MQDAERAGARFLVSPGHTEQLLAEAKDCALPWLMGAASASEVQALREHGYSTLKFFPAEPMGGAATLKAFSPVFPDVVFCPTGGIDAARARDYLRLPNVVAVGGSWVAPPAAVAAGDFASITKLAAEAASLQRRFSPHG
jgi:2-dehydro-3-deoxyphosphogluconate aldolase/(4S)-4-hydroxy-2-oxoglutarate aldolase